MAISTITIKRLFAVSGNKCAFPSCQVPISDEENATIIGEICHIEASSPGGPRYNSMRSDEERQAFENLVLMCANHHKVIDGNPGSYTVDQLKKIKAEHEQKYANGKEPSDDVVIKLLLQNINLDNKIKYIELFKKELKKNLSGLRRNIGSFETVAFEYRPSILSTDIWDSVINTGALNLFTPEEAGDLSDIYNLIKSYNKDVTVFDALVDRSLTAGRDELMSSNILPRLNQYRAYLPTQNENMIKNIDTLLNTDWIWRLGN